MRPAHPARQRRLVLHLRQPTHPPRPGVRRWPLQGMAVAVGRTRAAVSAAAAAPSLQALTPAGPASLPLWLQGIPFIVPSAPKPAKLLCFPRYLERS